MQSSHIKQFRNRYGFLWAPLLEELPNWYVEPLEKLFAGVSEIGKDRLPVGAVILRFHRYLSGDFSVAVAPNKPIAQWTPDQALTLLALVEEFNALPSKLCRVCGDPAVGLFKTMMEREFDQFLCVEHGDRFMQRPASELVVATD
jgi:hypothetical protein